MNPAYAPRNEMNDPRLHDIDPSKPPVLKAGVAMDGPTVRTMWSKTRYIYLCTYSLICVTIYPSIYLCIHLSFYLSIYLSIHLSIYLSIYVSTIRTNFSQSCAAFHKSGNLVQGADFGEGDDEYYEKFAR
jgi:hypothetical protein